MFYSIPHSYWLWLSPMRFRRYNKDLNINGGGLKLSILQENKQQELDQLIIDPMAYTHNILKVVDDIQWFSDNLEMR